MMTFQHSWGQQRGKNEDENGRIASSKASPEERSKATGCHSDGRRETTAVSGRFTEVVQSPQVHVLSADCCVSEYESTSSHMDMLKVNSLQDIETLPLTSWNIRQPAKDDNSREEALASGGLDLILMPGLGFDRARNRLGRGKGFYDNYLERCKKHPKGKPYTIALAFKEQLCEKVPVDNHDVPIDEVLYEDEK
uniref:5-formyltetrahydrofolate cyclo-ligase n=1 Tax=Haplochromis burtoni TaxID=8153 RepID=A0A3Q3BUA5_HAPBU